MTYSPEEENLIVLDSIAGLSYQNKRELLCDFAFTTPQFPKHVPYTVKKQQNGVYEQVEQTFYSLPYRQKVLQELEQKRVVCVTFRSPLYPNSLRSSDNAPLVLYCRGDVSLLKQKLFSIVGSRQTLPWAEQNCRIIAEKLCRHFAVMSGCADGANAYALQGAIVGGKPVCLLPCGLDYVQPTTNTELVKEVEKVGLVISPFIPTMRVHGYMYAVANDILAAMSQATLLVSGTENSGSLTTVKSAIEYGKHVFAFPYNIGIASGEGCNAIIKKGAYLTESIGDIGEVFGLDFSAPDVQKLSKEEKAVYTLIKQEGEIAVPVLAAKLQQKPFQLAATLSALELKKLIVRMGGNRYAVVQ